MGLWLLVPAGEVPQLERGKTATGEAVARVARARIAVKVCIVVVLEFGRRF